MSTALADAVFALRPVRAALVGAPAPAGWIWGGGSLEGATDAVLVAVGAWGLALAAFAWNDRADLRRGVAHRHPSPRVRALSRSPGAAHWLLASGLAGAGLAVGCWILLGPLPGCMAVAVAASGWIYSDPDFFGKGRPRLAPALHLLGGAANGAAGAAAAGATGPEVIAWAATCGLLFVAAHRIHMVGDRDADLSVGVRTVATARSAGRAAWGAHRSLAAVAALTAVLGLSIQEATGSGLVAMGLVLALFLAMAGPEPDPSPAVWHRFQGRCRLAVAASASLGVVLTVFLRGSP